MSRLTDRLRTMAGQNPHGDNLYGEAADRIEELEAGALPPFPPTDDAPPWLIYGGTDGATRQVDRPGGFTHIDARELHILEALVNHCADLLAEARMQLGQQEMP